MDNAAFCLSSRPEHPQTPSPIIQWTQWIDSAAYFVDFVSVDADIQLFSILLVASLVKPITGFYRMLACNHPDLSPNLPTIVRSIDWITIVA
jgi:hypothetical protein